MNNGQTPYRIPEEILSSARDESERRDLAEAWNAVMQAPVSGTDPRKDAVKTAVMRVAQRNTSDRPAVRIARHARILTFPRFQLIAASVVLLICVSFVLSPSVNTSRAPAGSLYPTLVQLDDGTTVRLSPGSRLTTTEQYGDESRRVNLNGKAFFDVAHNPEVPFEVRTFNSTTTVLGTEFSVQAWPDDFQAGTRVVVASGSVSLQAGNDRELLQAGQMSVAGLNGDAISDPEVISPARELVWLDGGFAYSNEPVGNVLRDLERRYDSRLQAPASIRLRPISYWKNVAPESLAEVLADISTTIGVRFRATANGYEMYLP